MARRRRCRVCKQFLAAGRNHRHPAAQGRADRERLTRRFGRFIPRGSPRWRS